MSYVEFRNAIQKELGRSPEGLTWIQLQQRLDLPYDRPCQTWTYRLEKEIGLARKKGTGRALLWHLRAKASSG